MESPQHSEAKKFGEAQNEERVQPGLGPRKCVPRVHVFTSALFSPRVAYNPLQSSLPGHLLHYIEY